jgi:hypothetical protein
MVPGLILLANVVGVAVGGIVGTSVGALGGLEGWNEDTERQL